MQEVRVTAPVERSAPTARIAIEAGVPGVRVYDIFVHGLEKPSGLGHLVRIEQHPHTYHGTTAEAAEDTGKLTFSTFVTGEGKKELTRSANF